MSIRSFDTHRSHGRPPLHPGPGAQSPPSSPHPQPGLSWEVHFHTGHQRPHQRSHTSWGKPAATGEAGDSALRGGKWGQPLSSLLQEEMPPTGDSSETQALAFGPSLSWKPQK